jgi:hypothetical protein
MIHYQLQCQAGHGFDSWFKDSATFERQAQGGLLSCPACGDTQVTRALMAPSLARSREPAPPAPLPARSGKRAAVAGAGMPDQVRAVLQRIREEVERSCDYVGADFAEEARRIHNGESERRGIYGETTPDEAAALAEDGVEFASVPWLPRSDA